MKTFKVSINEKLKSKISILIDLDFISHSISDTKSTK